MSSKNKWFEVIPEQGGYMLHCYRGQKLLIKEFFWNCFSCGWRGAKNAAFFYGDKFMYGSVEVLKQ